MKGDTVININLYIHPAPVEVTAMFEQILQQLALLTKAEKQEAQAMSQLEDQVAALEQKIAAENDAVTGAEGLLTNLSQLYKDALASGGNSDAIVERIKAVNAAVDAKTADLAASVVANTPAAPTT